MKTIFALISSAALQLSIFAAPAQSAQNPIPSEVEALIADLRENLNAGELLQYSRDDIVGLVRDHQYKSYPKLYKLEPGLVPHLTDDEIADFVTSLSHFSMVCSTSILTTIEIQSRFQRLSPSALSQLPLACDEFMHHFSGQNIDTREKLADFLTLAQTHATALATTAEELATSPYHKNELFAQSLAIAYSSLWQTTNTFTNISSLKNASIYSFTRHHFRGLIAFERGQARLIQFELSNDNFMVLEQIPSEVKALANQLKQGLNIGPLLQHSRDDIVELARFKSDQYKQGGWYNGLNPEIIPHLTDDEIVDFATALGNARLVCYSYALSHLPADSNINPNSFFPPACASLLNYFDDSMKIETEDELSELMQLLQNHSSALATMAQTLVASDYDETAIYKYNEKLLNKYGMEVEGPFHEYVESSEHGLRNLGRFWRDTAQNIPNLKNAELYGFYISGLFAIVAFEQGQARIFMLSRY